MTRILSIMHRIFLAGIGFYLLVTSFPHSTPWDMTHFARDVYNHGLVFAFNPPFSATKIYMMTPAIFVIMVVFGLLAVTAIPPKTLGRMWQSLRSNKRAYIGGIAAVEILIITLMPSEPHFITTGPAAVLYLLFASFGLFFLFAGTFPLLRRLNERTPFSGLFTRTYEFLRHAVVDSPPSTFVTTLVLFELLLATTISHLVFEGIPHIQDSIAQLFHAKIFAEGSLTAPSPPVREFFDYINVINDGRWYSQYPPGHTIFLTLGVLAGLPSIINPLLGSLTVGVTYFLGKELFGELVGRLSALFAFLSPFILFMSSEFMNHSSALFLVTVFFLFFIKSLRSGSFVHGLIAGAAIGWVGCIRPYTAIALATPALLYGLIRFFKGFDEVKKPALGFSISVVVFIGLLLGFNQLTNGNPFLFGYEKLWGPLTGIGFGKGPWGPPHTPLNGLQQTISNLNGINKYLFEWPVPSLLFVVLLFFSGKTTRWDFLLVSTFGSALCFYFFYWFQDWCFGPRFLFEASTALIILTARGIENLPAFWNDVLGYKASIRNVRMASVALLMILTSLGLATNIPPHLENYGNSYWGVSAEILDKVEERGIKRAVIFVRSNYGKGFVGVDPFMRNEIVYVNDQQEDNRRIVELYADYDYYLAVAGTLTRFEPGTPSPHW